MTDVRGGLAALTAAAMALPALQARAAARDENTIVSLQASQYFEDKIPEERLASSEDSRYDISVVRARLGTPVFDSLRVTADVGYETMSGASPWFVQPDAQGRPVQVMSGATIDEERIDASLDTRFFGSSSEHALVLGASNENDYQSLSAGLESLFTLGDEHTSLNLGASYSDDTVEPTEGGSARFPSRVIEETRDSVNGVIGLTRILGPRTVAQTAVSVTVQSGYLDDPYKQAWIESGTDSGPVADHRPDQREQLSWTTRLRHRFSGLGASLHVNYRYYSDSWKLDSHTLETAWYQHVGDRWWIAPSLRYYSQSQTEFYRPYYTGVRADGYYSSDYRLSPYGAITAGLLLRCALGEHAVSLSVQYYDSDADYALEKVEVENPGLVDFVLATLGVDFSL